MSNKSRLGMAVVLLIALISTPAFAQTASSSITGVVVDSGGGFVPGATVVVKSESTGAESNAVSSSNGSFTVPALNVGSYTVTVSLQGFKHGGPQGRRRDRRHAGNGPSRPRGRRRHRNGRGRQARPK